MKKKARLPRRSAPRNDRVGRYGIKREQTFLLNENIYDFLHVILIRPEGKRNIRTL